MKQGAGADAPLKPRRQKVESSAAHTEHSIPFGGNGGLRASAVAHASVNSLYL